PKIAEQYKVSLGETTLVLALYTVFGTAVTPILGKLGDIHGKKKVLVYVLVAYSVMVVITSFTPDFNTLLISRTFQGVGLAVVPLSFSLAREQFPRKMVPQAQAMISGALFGGIGLGVSAGAFVSNDYGWQTNYHIVAPVIVILTALMVYRIRESPNRRPGIKLDYGGSVLLGASLAMVIFGLAQGSQWGWTSPSILGLLSGGIILLIPLVLYERRAPDPLLDFRKLRQRNVAVANFLALIAGVAILISFTTMIVQLEDGYAFDIFTTGLYVLPFAIVMLLMSYPVGFLNTRVGVKPILLIGSAIGAIGFVLFSTLTAAIQIPEYAVIVSVGVTMLVVSRQVLLVLSVEPADMGTMTSINLVFLYVGQSIGAPLAAAILTSSVMTVVSHGVTFALPTASAYQETYIFSAAALVASLVVTLFAKEILGRQVATVSA
ncbi:MAG TPA: MFS transporter, partial [Nitrososphaerales archaeon]|nr:MFS transporter [Nitrososphaerales archaeon]